MKMNNNEIIRNEIESKVAAQKATLLAQAEEWEMSARNLAHLKIKTHVLNIHGKIAALQIIRDAARANVEALKQDMFHGTDAQAEREREELALILA